MTFSPRTRGTLCLLAAAFLWSTGGLFIKLIPWAPMSINSARCLIAMAMQLMTLRCLPSHLPSRTTWIAGIGFFFTALLLTVATKWTTAANAILLQYTSPLFIILYESLRRRQWPGKRDGLCAAGVLIGISFFCTGSTGLGNPLGNVIALLSGVSFAVMFLFGARSTTEPAMVNLIGFFLGGAAGLPWLLQERSFSASILFWLLALGIGQFWLAYTLFSIGVQLVGPLGSNFLSTLEPVLNPLWVAIFYGEPIHLRAILGGIIILISTITYNLPPLRHNRPKHRSHALDSTK